MRLIFCGTPEFAASSLRAVHAAGHEILAVVSQPDRPRGRGQKLHPSPIRALAQELGLPDRVLEKGKAAREALYSELLELKPDVILVVAFGHIIREPLLNGAPHGCLNVHGSLLPRWRGPAPVHRGILAGDRLAGISTMRLSAGVDTGPVYERRALAIGPEETAGQLYDRLAHLGGELLVETLAEMAAGNAVAVDQDEEGVTHAPLLHKNEGSCRFDRPTHEVHDRIRAFNPWPGIQVRVAGTSLKLWESGPPEMDDPDAAPGTILSISDEGMRVACADGVLLVQQLQPAGRPRMAAADYARGHGLEAGMVLEAREDFHEWRAQDQ